MSALPITLKKSQYQSILLLGLLAFFVAHFTLLNPSGLEEDFSEMRTIAPDELLSFFQNENQTLAKNVPTQIAPAYSIRELELLSTDHERKHWRLLARKSFSYQQEQLMHARDVTFFWADGKITAKEAVNREKTNEVEVYGDVVATLNNGLIINTEYVKIITAPITQITVPLTEIIKGHQQVSKNTLVQFQAMGAYYSGSDEILKLLSNTDADIITDKKTHVRSDSAIYDTKKEVLLFDMMESKTLDQQFVQTKQTDLFLHSRKLRADLENKKLQTLTAIGAASFEDYSDAEHPVSGTGGRIIYKEATNLVFLMDFPQVYQDNDTITGDTIVYDRTRDTIEVDQSNAFNKR